MSDIYMTTNVAGLLSSVHELTIMLKKSIISIQMFDQEIEMRGLLISCSNWKHAPDRQLDELPEVLGGRV